MTDINKLLSNLLVEKKIKPYLDVFSLFSFSKDKYLSWLECMHQLLFTLIYVQPSLKDFHI